MKKDVIFILAFIIAVLLICAAFAFVLVKMADRASKQNSSAVEDKTNSGKVVKNLDVNTTKEICIDTSLNVQNGTNVTSPGKTCVGSACSFDKCISNWTIQEFYCLNNKIASINNTCPIGSFCKKGTNSLAYCSKGIQEVVLKADKTKVSYIKDGAKDILFYATVKMAQENNVPFSVFLTMSSQSSGKYAAYNEKEMILNKATKRYELKVRIKNIETYQENTNLTAQAIVKINNALVAKSNPSIVMVSWP